jgi:hypothetical protein
MLALLLGFFPTSAIASQFAANCEMACCVGKPAHEMADPVCLKGCESMKGQRSNSPSSLSQAGADGCKCSIGSSPNTSQPDIVATVKAGLQIQQAVADVPSEHKLIPTLSEPELEPGIFGADSGPPAYGPNYVSLGRAPPIA